MFQCTGNWKENREYYPTNEPMENQLLITPKTKVLQLIEAYPMLEEVLINAVPAFEKLKNPVLRKTVARIATLQQAAAIGNIPVGDLINTLRKKVGQDLISDSITAEYRTLKPFWFDEKLIRQDFDAGQMLAAGEQPVNQVMADLNNLESRTIYRLTAPFLPAPLIDKASSLGIDHWLKKEKDDLFLVYFYKA
jgi:hypothetical protein